MATKKAKKATTGKAVEVMEKPEEILTQEPKKQAAARAAKARKTKIAAPAESKYFCVIDYPVNGETVSGLHYAIRMGASDVPGAHVEVQINGGDWTPARFADGFWWFDWGYFTPGPHKIQARIIDQDGKVYKKSAITKCTVV